jgi:hypothetical protein
MYNPQRATTRNTTEFEFIIALNNQKSIKLELLFSKAVFNTLNMTRYTQKICNQLCLNSSLLKINFHIKLCLILFVYFFKGYVLTQCGCIDPALPSIDPAQSVCNTIATLACVSASRIQYYDDDVTCDVW